MAILACKSSWRSVRGWVLGISNTLVTPPSTAPRVPASSVSLWVIPGSRKCTWESTTPGSRCRPRASISVSAERDSPMATIRPSWQATSVSAGPLGSMTVAPLISRVERLRGFILMVVFSGKRERAGVCRVQAWASSVNGPVHSVRP